jgi:hypothetical protein
MAEMSSREHAAALVRYYERLSAEKGTRYAESLRLAREWLRLIESEHPSRAEILALVRALETGENSGSGWTDMALGVGHWARTRGLPV